MISSSISRATQRIIFAALVSGALFACGGKEEDRTKIKPKPTDTGKPQGYKTSAPEDPLKGKTEPTTTPEKNTNPNYEVIAVTDKGAIKGTVKWSGDLPATPELPVNKDNDACGKSRPNPRLVVDSASKGVSNTVVYLENITKGADLTPKDGVIDQKACEYIPHVQIVPRGSSIKALNSDPILHNVHSYLGEDSVFNIAMPIQGQETKKPLKKSGIVSLKCDAGHTWMSGYIVVADHPYYALTDAQGNFTIDNIPPGKYTLKLWHEGVETTINGDTITYSADITQTQEVEVAKDQTAEVSFELKK